MKVLLLLLDRKVGIVQAAAAAVSVTSCIAVLIVGLQRGGVVVVRVELFRCLASRASQRRAGPRRAQGGVAGPRTGVAAAVPRRQRRPLLVNPRRDGRQSVLRVVLRVSRKLLLLLLLSRRERLIGDVGRRGRVGRRVGARRGRIAEEEVAAADIVASWKTLVMVVEVLVAVKLRVVRHRGQDLSSVSQNHHSILSRESYDKI